MTPQVQQYPGFLLQDQPRIYVAVFPGGWLLKRTTPSWRIENPELGFQRMVREKRAREIALAVLDQKRSFPNAIVLATDVEDFETESCKILIPSRTRFLVVDGQHRLWAQKFSEHQADYACMVHVGLTEVEMASLFLEINDNQRRVPSSLRWDLVRLVRPEGDPYSISASELIVQLAADEASPLFQRIDRTGEIPEIHLKQGSLAPEIRQILTKKSPLHDLSFDEQYELIVQYLLALRSLNRKKWGHRTYELSGTRVLRAILRLLPEIIRATGKSPVDLKASDFSPFLKRIDVSRLTTDAIRAAQGNAGIREIYAQLQGQILGRQ